MPEKMNCYDKLLKVSAMALFLLFPLTAGGLSAQTGEKDKDLVLAGFQMTVTNNIKENQDKIIGAIGKAAKDGADFLVTPEGSLSGYTSNFNQKELTPALAKVTEYAKEMKTGLMLGTCYKETIRGREYCYNQVRVYAPDGKFLGAYSKILRCSSLDLPGTGEMTDYIEGELKVFNWNGFRFGTLICNDLWATPGYTTMPNPYLPWKLKQMGAQLIVHCINSGTMQKYRPFHESSAELWASALNIPIMEVNAAQGKERINARSGLIEHAGERINPVMDTGDQYFLIRVDTSK